MSKTIKLDSSLLTPCKSNGRIEQGVYSFISRYDEVQKRLEMLYGRTGLCLKVFKKPISGREWVSDYTWGEHGATLMDGARAQNLFARYGLAPRVYDVVVINGCYIAQVTDYVENDGNPFDRQLAVKVVREHKVKAITGDVNKFNWVGSQMVDFQYHLLPSSYGDMLVKRAVEVAAWGSRSEPYQALLGKEGQRDFARRIEPMRLDEIDFAGRSVLDVGCNLGDFCRDAEKRGAKRITGVDLPYVADLAYDLSNWLGYWTPDFIGAHLPAQRDRINGKFDVVYALSCKQCKPFPWILEHCGDVLYVEGHVAEKEHHYRPILEQPFGSVECLGATKDHGPRPLLRCRR